MKKLYFYFLLIILSSLLVYGISEEQTLLAKVTVNPVSGVLNVFPGNLLVNAPPLSFAEKTLTFWQENGNQDLNVTLFLEISEIKDWISFSENNFIVKPSESKDIITYIDIPNIEIGTYSGNIHAITNTQDLIIPVDITVTDKYKIDVNIDVSPKEVYAGNNISILTKLVKLKLGKFQTEGRIPVTVTYDIFKRGDLVTTLTTSIDVINSSEKIVSVKIPENAASGRYRVAATATHVDKTAKDKDNFSVTKNLLRILFNFFRWFG